jgi:hypothetical protein
MTHSDAHKLIEKVRNGEYSERELINLYKNAETHGASDVMEAIKRKMRADFPRAANRLFGAKEAEARMQLESVLHDLSNSFNFGSNQLKNGVKAGGGMLSGEKHIDVYISYKNKERYGVALSLSQDDPESELIATFYYYKDGKSGFREKKQYQMHDFAKAVNAYKKKLSEVLKET